MWLFCRKRPVVLELSCICTYFINYILQIIIKCHKTLFLISNIFRSQAEQQLKQHQELLEQINSFQSNLDAVREIGEKQVDRYKDVNQDIDATIKQQHMNIQV